MISRRNVWGWWFSNGQWQIWLLTPPPPPIRLQYQALTSFILQQESTKLEVTKNAKFRPLLNDHTRLPRSHLVTWCTRWVDQYDMLSEKYVKSLLPQRSVVEYYGPRWHDLIMSVKSWMKRRGLWRRRVEPVYEGRKDPIIGGTHLTVRLAEVIILDFYGAAIENSLRHVQQNVEKRDKDKYGWCNVCKGRLCVLSTGWSPRFPKGQFCLLAFLFLDRSFVSSMSPLLPTFSTQNFANFIVRLLNSTLIIIIQSLSTPDHQIIFLSQSDQSIWIWIYINT